MNSAFRVDVSTLEQLLPYFKNNRLKSIDSSTISPYVLQQLAPCLNNEVVGSLEDETRIFFLIDHESSPIELTIRKKLPVDRIDPDLAPFDMEDEIVRVNRKKATYDDTLLHIKQFDLDIKNDQTRLKDELKHLKQQEESIKAEKEKVLSSWNAQRAQLYEQKGSLIQQNKQLYQQRLELSSAFYGLALEEQASNRSEHMKRYRSSTQEANRNKDDILDVQKHIDAIERKIHLYQTNTYFYDSRPTITIRVISIKEKDEILSRMGGNTYRFISKKKGGEYATMESYYEQIKKKIKKMNKENQLSNRELVKQLYKK
jgi:hypothetical protein